MKNAITLKNVTKRYNQFQLGPINLDIPSGTIVGLIGENGAGKTTLIKSILNLIRNDEGEIKLFLKDVKDPLAKEDIGVVLDNMFFPILLNSVEIEKCMMRIYKNWDTDLFYKLLNDFSISPNKILKELSKGMKKKVEIACALAHHPKLLILDEPTSGLDPVVRNEILDLFMHFVEDEEHTILFSTHITSDLEHIADSIVFISKGEIILNQNRDTLMDEYGILKCSIDEVKSIEKEDILALKEEKYSAQILVKNREKIRKKYKDFIVDKVTLEELMVLFLKGRV